MTYAQRNAIVNPAAGLIVYCTDCANGEMQFYNGTSWINMSVGAGSVPFTTPIISTRATTGISSNGAFSGGNITSSGGANVTARGVCWSTSVNPTIALATKTNDGTGIGLYASTITGLMVNTTYHVRAFATNSVGTSYGRDSSFITTIQPYSYTMGPNVTDVNGNVYSSIVTSCGQTWTNKNLNVSRYRNGDTIPKVTDATTWHSLPYGAYCYFNNDSATYAAVYGKLYNWYAVNDPRGLAPAGWHVPSDAEWTTLENCLGGPAIAGGAMKETGTAHWESPNAGATNNSGFAGLPGGGRSGNGTINDVGFNGDWWSSDNQGTMASGRNLYYNYSDVYTSTDRLTDGFSVRCVKD